LPLNTTGDFNTAVGRASLFVNTTGANNTAVGGNALVANTTGGSNTGIGVQALSGNTTGGSNTSLGYQSLLSNTTASNNTAVGYQAGYTNTTGAYNTFIGYQAGYTSNATTNGLNVAVGVTAGYSLTTGTNNTFVGAQGNVAGCGYYVTTGSKNTILGGYNGNQGGLDIRTASNHIVLSDGDGNPRLILDGPNGNLRVPAVYALTTASASNMFVASDGYIYRSTSALKYKQDVRNLEDIDISALRPVRYKSKGEKDDQTKDHFGLIADEAADAGFEELVTRGADGEVEGFQYERLTVVLLKELQTLRARVAQLESQGA
jgi:hypothetical protein